MACKGPGCSGCEDGQCYSKGGRVSESDSQKGVHDARGGHGPGSSFSGSLIRSDTSVPKSERMEWAKESHKEKLGELKSMKKPNLYADGGEVEEQDMSDDEMDSALSDAACGELLEAIEKKDKAGILESLRALVLSVR